MKKLIQSGFLFCIIFLSNNVKAQTLLAGWTFDATATAPSTPTSIGSNLGIYSGTVYADGTNGSSSWVTATSGNELNAFGGTTTNDPRSSAAVGNTYSLVSSTANLKSIVFKVATTNYSGIKISYATQRTTTGFNSQQWQYSTDGVFFTNAASAITGIGTGFGTFSVDLSAVTALNNVPAIYLRVIVNGASNASGNNRIDNVQITSTNSTWSGALSTGFSTQANWIQTGLNSTYSTVPVSTSDINFAGSPSFSPVIYGDTAVRSITFNSGASGITFGGSSALKITVTNGITNSSNNNQTFNPALSLTTNSQTLTGQLTLGNMTVAGGLTVTIPDIVDMQANKISFSGAGGTVAVNGTLKTSNLNGLSGSTTTTLNSITNSPTLSLGANSIIEYNASVGVQTISGLSNYKKVVLSNAATKTLGGAATIDVSLTLNAGNTLALAGSNLTIASSAIISGANASQYIATTLGGQIIRQIGSGGGSFIFPIGSTTTTYSPLTITNTGGSNQTYTVGVGGTSYTPGTNAVNYEWSIGTAGGTSASNLAFSWNTANSGSAITSLTPIAEPGMVAALNNATIFGTTLTGTPNITTVTGVTNFSNTAWQLIANTLPNLTPTTLASFGYAPITTTPVNSFFLSGHNLNGTNVTISAVTGYEYATNLAGPYSSTLTFTTGGSGYTYAGGRLLDTVYVKFLPTVVNTVYNGTITVTGGGVNTTYDLELPISGIGSQSTVTRDPDFTYPNSYAGINPVSFIADGTGTPLTISNAVNVMGLRISDLPGDGLSTTLTNITFTMPLNTGDAIKAAALHDGTNFVSQLTSVSGTTFSFSSLSLVAPDGGVKNFQLYVTFENVVTDNTQLGFTVSAVTTTGSPASSLGSVVSPSSLDSNKLLVTATKLLFTTQPPTTGTINTTLTTQPAVTAQNALGSVDVDFNTAFTVKNSITGAITTSGMSNVPTTYNSGVITFSGFNFTTTGSGKIIVVAGAISDTSTAILITNPLATYTFTGTACSAAALTATLIVPNVTFSNPTITGENCTTAGGATTLYSIGGINWPTSAAAALSKYIEFTVTPAANYILTLSSMSFDYWRSAAGPQNLIVRSSADGYASDLFTVTSNNVTLNSQTANFNLPSANFTNRTTAVTFRIYGWLSPTSTGDLRLDNISLVGYAIITPPPYLSVTTPTAFTSTDVGAIATSKSFTLSGANLTGFPNNITVTAPSSDFQVSLNNSTFTSSVLVPYTSATLASTTLWVRYTPQSVTNKIDTILLSGGGASGVNIPLLIVSGVSDSATFYSKSSGNLNAAGTWTTNSSGSGGIAPVNFTTAHQTFIVINNASPTIGAAWTVSGTGSKVIVGDGTFTTNFTIPASFQTIGNVDVQNHGTLTIQHASPPTLKHYLQVVQLSMQQLPVTKCSCCQLL